MAEDGHPCRPQGVLSPGHAQAVLLELQALLIEAGEELLPISVALLRAVLDNLGVDPANPGDQATRPELKPLDRSLRARLCLHHHNLKLHTISAIPGCNLSCTGGGCPGRVANHHPALASCGVTWGGRS